MKALVKKIIPGFLIKLDAHLLRNKPLLWASRLHYLIFFELLLLTFNISISSFQPIGFTNIPKPIWILVYSIVSNLVLIVCWIYYQVLLDIIYFQSNKIHLLNWRIATLFSVVFLFISFSAIFPFMNLNRRIVDIFNDDHFPEYRHTFSDEFNSGNYELVDSTAVPTPSGYVAAPSTDTASYIDSFHTEKSPDYFQLARIQDKYDIMNSREKFNILVSLREIDFAELDEFSLNNNSDLPNIRYRLHYYNYLTIFYNNLVMNDSFYIKKFDIKVYQREIQARIDKRDTIIERYYFLSKTSNQFIICDRTDILKKLVENKIDDAFTRAYPNDKITRKTAINRVFYNYSDAVSCYKDRGEIFHLGIFIGSALAIAILVCTAFIRLLGTKAFAIGSSIVILITGILFAFLNYSNFSGDRRDIAAASIFICFWIFGFLIYLLVKSKSTTSIIFLFVGTCSLAIGNWVMPILGDEFIYHHLNDYLEDRDQTLYLECWLSLTFLFIFAGIFIRKLQKIYCLPNE